MQQTYLEHKHMIQSCVDIFALDLLSTCLQVRVRLRSSRPEVFLEKGVLKICSKFTGEHPCRSAISIIIEITLRHGFSPVNLMIFSEHLFLGTPLDGCFCILAIKICFHCMILKKIALF